MVSSVQHPNVRAFVETVGGLINKSVKAVPLADKNVGCPKEHFVGTYDDGQGRLEAAIVMDLAACASFGSAFSLISPNVAKEAIKEKRIDGDIKDNAYEVANVLANSFVGKRVRLVGFVSSETASTQVQEFLSTCSVFSSFEVTVQGYPMGTVSFCS